MRNSRRIVVLLVVLMASVFQMSLAYAGDGPTGFYWGSDSNAPAPGTSASSCASSSVPWLEPNVTNSGCGHYGGYFGEVGTFTVLRGCTLSRAWNSTAASRANANQSSGDGMGTAPYWFGGGPGADPNYNGTTTEAYAWGQQQAQKAVSLAGSFSIGSYIMVLDVEEPGGGFYTGWNETVTGCGSLGSSSACCATGVDRATFNGFWDYIWNNTASYFPAVYSAPAQWPGIFGTGSDGTLTNTMEWTWDYQSGCVNPGPIGWTQSAGSCSSRSASFFAGITSGDSCAVAWQWSAGSNDYDQIDTARLYSCN